jgi:hypothetical protein
MKDPRIAAVPDITIRTRRRDVTPARYEKITVR